MKTKIVSGKDLDGKMYYAVVSADGKVLTGGYPTRRAAEAARKELDKP